ncbi:MAG: hypothetical protein ACM33V_09870, partial [Chloroflexota bacterium]
NGRGYTMLFVFSLLLANFGGILVDRQSKSALIAYGLTAALGFYTIPIFLYPMAGVSLWVATTHLLALEPWRDRLRRLAVFLATCLLAGILTFLLYSPVIVFGTGFSSIIGNEFVKSQDWSAFVANLGPRLSSVWDKWTIGLSPTIEYLFLIGFLLSLVFYRKTSNQKLPMQVFLVLALAILLILQRVTPTPRIWLYLDVFYLMFVAAGWVWLIDWLARRWIEPSLAERSLSFAILLVFLAAFTAMLISHRQIMAGLDTHSPEEYAAQYLAEHIQPEDTLVATGPVDIETAYYLSLRGVSFDRFYKRDHPVQIQNALVLVRKKTKYETPESVIKFFKLDQTLNIEKAELVFEYANVQVYSVPTR